MTDYLKSAAVRAARTFAQTFVGVYLAGLVGSATNTLGDFANLSLLDSAAAAGLVAVLSLVQNLLEERTSVSYNRG